MPLWTPEYAALQTRFHVDREDYGCSGQKHVEIVLNFAEQLKTRDILDYACGKATLQKGLPFPIQNYDPFMPEYSRRPEPADLVVCTDVMEHIELECLAEVLADLKGLTKKLLYMNVATGPAKKILPDGRNAHITQRGSSWWLQVILEWFDLHSFQAMPTSFTCLLTSRALPAEDEDAPI